MTNQTPALAHLPTTLPEIDAMSRDLAARDAQLLEEARELYQSIRKGGQPSPPVSEHDRRVGEYLKPFLNGKTPPHLLAGYVSRDSDVRAEREAISIVLRELSRRREAAREAEATAWIARTAADWKSLCRDIVLQAERLYALEEAARTYLENIKGIHIRFPMSGSIGSGLSLLGTGSPTRELLDAALKEGVVTESEIRKAQKL